MRIRFTLCVATRHTYNSKSYSSHIKRSGRDHTDPLGYETYVAGWQKTGYNMNSSDIVRQIDAQREANEVTRIDFVRRNQ